MGGGTGGGGGRRERGSTKPVAGTVFHVLLALADRSRYGLEIADEVGRQTDGGVELGPGTLYNALARMLEEGLIDDAPPPTADPSASDPRRKYYRITQTGRAVLAEEADRLARVVDAARTKAVLP